MIISITAITGISVYKATWTEAFPADMIIPIMPITGSGKDNTDTLHEKGKSNITCCAPDFKNERFT